MELRNVIRTTAIVVAAVGALTIIGALVVRDQISRSRRDLFSPQPLRRLAALRYLTNAEASVDLVQLLRDFIAWETRPMIRRQAVQLLERMEKALAQSPAAEEYAG